MLLEKRLQDILKDLQRVGGTWEWNRLSGLDTQCQHAAFAMPEETVSSMQVNSACAAW